MSDDTPIIIDTEWGPVTESARLQAAANMKARPEIRQRVVDLIGEAEARRRYPEAWEDDDSAQT